MKTVIKAENVSKQYRLGTIGYGTLREDLRAWWARLRGKEDPNAKIGEKSRIGQHGEFWALTDINFEIKEGDRVGIIGRNGAGKSTLLKIISRITAPTTGRIGIKGRVASLLEVGTGFHPELTGRENIFMNGAILGMKRREIQKKFDEIVDFAGVKDFIDTPVKRYSSGMYVRLGFAVAAHLESEILIVDEVLAVGDAEFQKKAIGRMEALSTGEGRTVLFVSHNIKIIENLCNSCLLLFEGKILEQGQSDFVISRYLNLNSLKTAARVNKIDLVSLLINNQKEASVELFDSISIELKFDSNLEVNTRIDIAIDSISNQRLFWDTKTVNKKTNQFSFNYESININPGLYTIVVYVEANNEVLYWSSNAANFRVSIKSDKYRYLFNKVDKGLIILKEI